MVNKKYGCKKNDHLFKQFQKTVTVLLPKTVIFKRYVMIFTVFGTRRIIVQDCRVAIFDVTDDESTEILRASIGTTKTIQNR